MNLSFLGQIITILCLSNIITSILAESANTNLFITYYNIGMRFQLKRIKLLNLLNLFQKNFYT